jgi:predicted dehydrogenase
VRVGIVGCGFAGREHHIDAIEAAGGGVAAVHDSDPDALRAAADRAGARAYGTLDELLADPAVEVVAVCSPPGTHREVAVAALESGRDVLIEKPLALSLDDCETILAARERTGRTAAVAFNLRHHPNVIAARRAVADGELGTLDLLEMSWSGSSHEPAGEWGRRPASGGFTLLERGSHLFDLAAHLSGRAAARAVLTGDPSKTMSAQIELGEGEGSVLATIAMTEFGAPRNRIELLGDRGHLEVGLYAFDGLRRLDPDRIVGGFGARARLALRAPAKLPAGVRAARGGGVFRASYANEWRELAAVRTGSVSDRLASVEDGRDALALVLALAASTREGRQIDVAAGPRTLAEAGIR